VLFRCDCDGGGNEFSLVSASNVVDEITSWQNFSSKYFTLSFKIPSDFEVKESNNYIKIAKKPFIKSDLGTDNAFLNVIRYDANITKANQIEQYRKQLKDVQETNILVDGFRLLTITGTDTDSPIGGNAGKVTAIFFDKSLVRIIDRPDNKDTDNTFYSSDSPNTLGNKIVSTMKFSK